VGMRPGDDDDVDEVLACIFCNKPDPLIRDHAFGYCDTYCLRGRKDMMTGLRECLHCKRPSCKRRCSLCLQGFYYCDTYCQKADWYKHKRDCKKGPSRHRK
jgi:hypothetical protein